MKTSSQTISLIRLDKTHYIPHRNKDKNKIMKQSKPVPKLTKQLHAKQSADLDRPRWGIRVGMWSEESERRTKWLYTDVFTLD